MSASGQNFVFTFGKKKADAQPNVMSQERLNQIRQRSGKYLVQHQNGSHVTKNDK